MALMPIFKLCGYLNSNFNNPTGVDPFNPASTVIPQQSGAYTGDSSVTPLTNSQSNYNFAVARVRMRGPQGSAGEAQNTRVFFRLWNTQSANTDYQPSTYPSHTDAAELPDWPQPAADSSSSRLVTRPISTLRTTPSTAPTGKFDSMPGYRRDHLCPNSIGS
jgi:hypothetical protein